jgi:hypothetical protein
MTIERFALLWGATVGLVAGVVYLSAWRDPGRNRLTRLIEAHLTRMTLPWWRPPARLQMFIIAIVCFALALFGVIVFVTGQ